MSRAISRPMGTNISHNSTMSPKVSPSPIGDLRAVRQGLALTSWNQMGRSLSRPRRSLMLAARSRPVEAAGSAQSPGRQQHLARPGRPVTAEATHSQAEEADDQNGVLQVGEDADFGADPALQDKGPGR